MIDMSKKYRTRDGRAVRLLCVDGPGPSFTVAGYIGSLLTAWTAEGKSSYPGGQVDLIEVVPDVVMYEGIQRNCHGSISFESLTPLQKVLQNSEHPEWFIAIRKTTIRNGGKSHADVTVEVLPADYKETP